MNPKWKKSRARKSKAKRARRTRRKTQQTLYKYLFSQKPAYIITKGTVSGATNSVTGYNTGSTSTALLGAPQVAKSGLTDFYDFGQAFQFKLNDLSSASAYTTLYDQWRLDSVSVSIEFLSNNVTVGSLALLPTIYAIIDRDDSAIPADVGKVCGRQGHKIWKYGNKMKTSYSITLKPKAAMTVYNDSTMTGIGYAQSPGTWQDCDSSQNTFYGLKLFYTDVFAPNSSSLNSAFKVDVRFNVSFRAPITEA